MGIHGHLFLLRKHFEILGGIIEAICTWGKRVEVNGGPLHWHQCGANEPPPLTIVLQHQERRIGACQVGIFHLHPVESLCMFTVDPHG